MSPRGRQSAPKPTDADRPPAAEAELRPYRFEPYLKKTVTAVERREESPAPPPKDAAVVTSPTVKVETPAPSPKKTAEPKCRACELTTTLAYEVLGRECESLKRIKLLEQEKINLEGMIHDLQVQIWGLESQKSELECWNAGLQEENVELRREACRVLDGAAAAKVALMSISSN